MWQQVCDKSKPSFRGCFCRLAQPQTTDGPTLVYYYEIFDGSASIESLEQLRQHSDCGKIGDVTS